MERGQARLTTPPVVILRLSMGMLESEGRIAESVAGRGIRTDDSTQDDYVGVPLDGISYLPGHGRLTTSGGRLRGC